MAELFGVKTPTTNKHLNNIYAGIASHSFAMTGCGFCCGLARNNHSVKHNRIM